MRQYRYLLHTKDPLVAWHKTTRKQTNVTSIQNQGMSKSNPQTYDAEIQPRKHDMSYIDVPSKLVMNPPCTYTTATSPAVLDPRPRYLASRLPAYNVAAALSQDANHNATAAPAHTVGPEREQPSLDPASSCKTPRKTNW